MGVFQRLRSGSNLFIFIAGVVLAVFLILLITVVFLGQVQLKQVASQRALSELENQASALDYFIAEQKDALQELASDHSINSYLANKALGMSMEYGQRASLLQVVEQLRRLKQRKEVHGRPVYRSLVFFDPAGRPLADGGAVMPERAQWGPRVPHAASGVTLLLAGGSGCSSTCLTVPVIFKGRIAGFLVAEMDFQGVVKNLLQSSEWERDGRLALRDREGTVLFHRESTPTIDPHEPVLTTPVAAAGLVLENSFRLQDAEDYLVSPWLPGAISILTLPLLVGLGNLLRLNNQNMVLKTQHEVSQQKWAIQRRQTEMQRIISDAEAKRHESDTLFAKAFQAAGTLMTISVLDTGVLEAVNDAFIEITGYARDEAVGISSVELGLIATQDRDRLKRDILEGGSLRNLELKFSAKDRRVLYCLFSSEIIDIGGIEKLLSIAQDITPLKQSQLALKASEERFALAMRGSNDGVYDWDLCTNDIYFSPRWKSMLGYAENELENRFDTWELLVDPEGRKRSLAMLQDYIEGRRDNFSLELRVRHKDGHWVDVLSRAYLVRDRTGAPMRVVGTHLDITERKQAEQDLSGERAFLQHVIDGIDDPILVISPEYQIMRMNRAAKDAAKDSGLDPSCATCHQATHQCEQPCSGEDRPCSLRTILKTGLPCKVLHRHCTPNGEQRTFEIAASPLTDDGGQVIGIIEVSRDITGHLALLDELKEREVRYSHLAQHDPLTGLPNRLLFADRLSRAIDTAHRTGLKFAVLYIDLDQFKHVNDSFDHSYGDEVLRAVASRLQSLLREDDTIARMGGDEFTVLLASIRQDQHVALVAGKILDLFKEPFEILGHRVFLGCSIGISLYPEHGTTVDDLVRNADTAMYRAKDGGRNRFHYYSEDLTAKALERVLLESHLHNAVDRGELVLHYQPQLELATGDLCGLEALVRWQHPEMGLVLPAKFIATAEETGIIIPMGEWILREACRQMKAWQDAGIVTRNTLISVNLSTKQFDQSGLVEMIGKILDDTGLDPNSLELEITESTMMRSPDISGYILQQVRTLGIKVAIDDFGTGYSSMGHLKLLPLTKLKIDRSFVSDIPQDTNDIAIARAVIALGHSLSLEVLAEGIETREQCAFLVEEGCDSGQGYLFSRPLKAKDFEAYTARDQQW